MVFHILEFHEVSCDSFYLCLFCKRDGNMLWWELFAQIKRVLLCIPLKACDKPLELCMQCMVLKGVISFHLVDMRWSWVKFFHKIEEFPSEAKSEEILTFVSKKAPKPCCDTTMCDCTHCASWRPARQVQLSFVVLQHSSSSFWRQINI